jgi:hypothetical protein
MNKRALLLQTAGMPEPTDAEISSVLRAAGWETLVSDPIRGKYAVCERKPDDMPIYGIFWEEMNNEQQ